MKCNGSSFVLMAVLSTLTSGAIGKADQWQLAEKGKAQSVVIVSENATAIEKHAADELAHFLSKITGSQFEQSSAPTPDKYPIWLGTPENNPQIKQGGLLERVNAIDEQGFLLHADQNGLIIASKAPLGVLFGAYAFLEDHLGMRWFFPGETGEYCPSIPNLSIGSIDDAQEPAFKIRETSFSRAGPSANTPEAWDWIARNRMQSHYDSRHHDEYVKRGATVRGGGHILSTMVPEKLFAEHPEYFGEFDGERRPYSHNKRCGQPCLTHPDVVNLAAQFMLDWFEKNPNSTFTLDSNDNRNFCECETCKALDPPGEKDRVGGNFSTRFFTFKNEVAKRVFEKHPNARIRTLAYLGYRLTPSSDIELDPRHWVILCDHSRCFRHSLDDPNCEWNQGGTYAPEGGFLKMYEDWAKYKNPRGNFAYYNMIGQYRAREVPEDGIISVPIEHVVAADMRFQHKLGHEEWNIRLRPPEAFDPEKHPLRTTLCWRANIQWYYLQPKLAWNPDRDVDELLTDFYSGFYGPASDRMREFHTLIREAWENTPGHYLYHSTFAELGQTMNKEFIAKLEKLLDQAEHDAFEWTHLRGNPIFEKRIADEKTIFKNGWKLAYDLYQKK